MYVCMFKYVNVCIAYLITVLFVTDSLADDDNPVNDEDANSISTVVGGVVRMLA